MSFYEDCELFRTQNNLSRKAIIILLSEFIEDEGLDDKCDGYMEGADEESLREKYGTNPD
jgi:hypothetical protein